MFGQTLNFKIRIRKWKYKSTKKLDRQRMSWKEGIDREIKEGKLNNLLKNG